MAIPQQIQVGVNSGTQILFVTAGGAHNVSLTGTESVLSLAGPGDTGYVTISNVQDPVLPNDAANKQYVDSYINGLSWKQAVYLGSTSTDGNVDITTAPSTFDSITPYSGARILINHQTSPIENGLYYWFGTGSVMTRTPDFPEGGPLFEYGGSAVFIQAGSTLADTAWVETIDVGTIGTNNNTWVQFSSSGGAAAGSAGDIQYRGTFTGSFAASADLSWTSSTQLLKIGTVTGNPVVQVGKIDPNSAGEIDLGAPGAFTIKTETDGAVIDSTGFALLFDGVSTNNITLGQNLTSGSIILAGTSGTSKVNVQDVTTSTSIGNGALVVDGGVGIGGNLNVGQKFDVIGVTTLRSDAVVDSTFRALGVTTLGSDAVVGSTFRALGVTTLVSDTFIASISSSGDATSGALVVAGGVGIGGTLNVSGTISSLSGGVNAALDVSAGQNVTAGADVTAAQNITASAGDITATAGDIIATAGSVTAGTFVQANGGVLIAGTGPNGVIKVDGSNSATPTIENYGTGAFLIDNSSDVGAQLFNSSLTSNLTIAQNLTSGQIVLGGTSGGSTVNAQDTTQSTGTGSGAIITAGGVGIAKNLNVGQEFNVIGVTTLQDNTLVDANFNVTGVTTLASDANVGGEFNVFGVTTLQADTFIASGTDTSDPTSGALVVVGGVGVGGDVQATGDIYCNVLHTLSDIRFKENIAPISDPLEKLKKIEGISYNFIHNKSQRHYGVSAQQLEEQGFEDLVTENHKNKSVDYLGLVAYLLEAVKTINNKIEKITNQNPSTEKDVKVKLNFKKQ